MLACDARFCCIAPRSAYIPARNGVHLQELSGNPRRAGLAARREPSYSLSWNDSSILIGKKQAKQGRDPKRC